jgi:hypothetical protein
MACQKLIFVTAWQVPGLIATIIAVAASPTRIELR